MKQLLLIVILACTYVYSVAQYQVEWQKEYDLNSLSITFSQDYEEGLILNNRWSAQSTVFNQTVIINGMGEQAWSMDWNEELPNHSIGLQSINHRDSFIFIAQEPFVDSFILGLLVAEKGISWTKTIAGYQETGHLSEIPVSIHQDGFAILRNENSKSIISYLNYEGQFIWEDEIRRASPDHSRFLKMSNTIDDSFLIITREARIDYNSTGRMDSTRIPISLLPEGLPSYTTKLLMDSLGRTHFLYWTSQYYAYTVFDENMVLESSDTLAPSCPSFGDWKLFIDQGLNDEIILGGLEVCDSNMNFSSSILNYTDNIKNWQSVVSGGVHAMQTASDEIYYASSKQVGILNRDGTENWSDSIDTLSLFSDYRNGSLVVNEDQKYIYLMGMSFGPDSKLTIIKYVQTPSLLQEHKPRSQTCTVYPNPFSSTLKFTADVNHIDLFNMQGILIHSQDVQSNQVQLIDLPQGIYILRIDDIESTQVIKIDAVTK